MSFSMCMYTFALVRRVCCILFDLLSYDSTNVGNLSLVKEKTKQKSFAEEHK